MAWFKNLRLATQLTVSFVIVGLISVLTGGFGLNGTSTVSKIMNDTYNNNVVSIKYMADCTVQIAEACKNDRATHVHIGVARF